MTQPFRRNEPEEGARLGRAWLWARLPWWVAIAAVFTVVVVQLSMRFGRLQVDPQYDDVTYFLDGLDRLEQLQADGLRGLAVGYLHRPPHSPWSSFLAATCFALFGVQDWAPYLGNGLLILVLVGFVDFLAIGRGRWSRRLCLFMACTVPFAAQGVNHFCPDFAAGLFTAIGVVLLLRGNFADSTRAHQGAAGLSFGLALLAKPTGSVFTLGILFGALVLAGICDRVARRDLSFRRVAAGWGWCLGPMLVLAAPHYALAWRYVAAILEINISSPQAGVWKMSGGQPFPWYYHLTGLAGRMMLGNHLYLFAAICLASLAFVVHIRDRVAGVRHAAFGLVLAVAWALPTMFGSFNPFFAQTFTVLLLFCAVLAVCDVMPRVPRNGTRFLWARRLFVAGVVAAPFIRIAPWPSGGPPSRPQSQLHRQIYRDILRHVRTGSGERKERVFLTCKGDITPHTLTWLARKEGLHASFKAEGLSTDLNVFRREIDSSSFVLAVTARGNGKAHPWLPSGEVADAVLAMVRSRSDFREVAALGPLGTNQYYLFARVR
jgi:hypothetical protein